MRVISTEELSALPYDGQCCEFCDEPIDAPCLVWCELSDGEICFTAMAGAEERPRMRSGLYRLWHAGCLPRDLVSRTALAA
jgi:hypothetical protein